MTHNPYPVDSATRPCCGGIGTHTRDCNPDLPVPAGATTDGWHSLCGVTGRFVRFLTWWERTTAGVGVVIGGAQYSDGETTGPQITVYGEEDQDLTLDGARQLAATLQEAADELECLR